MTLFALLASLSLERLFKMGEHWRISHLFIAAFKRLTQPTLTKTLLLTVGWLILLIMAFALLNNLFFNLPLLIFNIIIGWLCIGAGITRRHYRDYLKAARNHDAAAMDKMANELAFVQKLPQDGFHNRLKALQNALIWINYRYYLAPIILFVIFGKFGAIALAVYALLRSYQTWLAKNKDNAFRAKTGVDRVLHWLDWLPVRLVCIAYALLGDSSRALPALKNALTDTKTSQYTILTELAQLSLSDETQTDPVKTPIAAVTLAKKISLAVIVIVSILTIYGAIV